MIRDVHPGSGSFYPSRIPDPGVGSRIRISGSTTLQAAVLVKLFHIRLNFHFIRRSCACFPFSYYLDPSLILTLWVKLNPPSFSQALLYCCEDNATAIVVPFGSWGKGDTSTSMFYSFGRSMIGSSRFG